MSTSELTIAVVTGTTRPGCRSGPVAALVAEVGRNRGDVEVIEVSPGDFELPGDGNDPEGKDARYTAITERCDAFLLVVPEYNHGYPGSLKRLLDSELENYNHKAVGFVGVSATPWGGTRGIQALVGPVREMGMVATAMDSYVPNSYDVVGDDGFGPEDRDTYAGRFAKTWDELCWMARALRAARQSTG